MSDLLNILSNSNKDIDNQKLMDYLSGKLPEHEKHEVEKWMADSQFMNDAIEGLEAVKNKEKISELVEQMNQDLQKKLEKKRLRKQKRQLKDQPWIYITILILILLIVISYLIIHRMMQQHP